MFNVRERVKVINTIERRDRMRINRFLGLGLIAIAATCCLANSLFAIDMYPPEWRGLEDTTYQRWEFMNSENPPLVEDDLFNPYGPPMATIWGMNQWHPVFLGHDGVWQIGGAESGMDLDIPNTDIPNPLKMIQLQMVYAATAAYDYPNVTTHPEADPFTLAPVQTVDLQDGFFYGRWEIEIRPSPYFEVIVLEPRFCEMYLDEIVVDTWCIPEPLTIMLLAGGALVLRRRRQT